MKEIFDGAPIDGLMEAMNSVLKPIRFENPNIWIVSRHDRLATPPIEFRELLAGVKVQGVDHPHLADHLWWLCVNDPRIVHNGKMIRRHHHGGAKEFKH